MNCLADVSPFVWNWGWLVIFLASGMLALVIIGIILLAVWWTGGFRN